MDKTNFENVSDIAPPTPRIPLEKELVPLVIQSYEGKYVDDAFNGTGVAKFHQGHMYEGDFCMGHLHGKGKFKWIDGTIYEGDFLENEITGTGNYSWPDGSSYSGQVRNGKRHGYGRLEATEGIYEGEWVHGTRHGPGTLLYGADRKTKYDGGWTEGRRNGYGTMIYRSGNKYEGEWVNDKKTGKGTMTWIDSSEKYQGDWLDDIQHGFGEHIWFDTQDDEEGFSGMQKLMCNRYVGNFVRGARQGRGTFYYANGSKFEGSWVNNLKDGIGVFTFEDGSIYQGRFKSDRMVDGKSSDQSLSSVKLYLDDIIDLSGDKERKNVDQLKRELSNTVLRLNTDLKNIYKYYSSQRYVSRKNQRGTSTEGMFTMSLRQMWMLVYDCSMLNDTVCLPDINRIFQTIRHQQKKAVRVDLDLLSVCDNSPSKNNEASHSKKHQTFNAYLHDGRSPILFREFVEALVRISFLHSLASSTDKTMAVIFNEFYQKNIQENCCQELYDDIEKEVFSSDVVEVYQKYSSELMEIFRELLPTSAQTECQSVDHPECVLDYTIDVRKFIKFLCSRGVLSFSCCFQDVIRDILQPNHATSLVSLDEANLSMLDLELSYWEFLDGLARLSNKDNSHVLPLHIKLENFMNRRIIGKKTLKTHENVSPQVHDPY